jgi:hypothetical protein
MDTLNSPSDDFNFNNLKLTTPISLNNGNHFIKYYLNDGPLYIQPPKCSIKQGIVKATKKLYFDLMFTNENDEFIRWLENLEIYSRKFIFENRDKWFETELDENDIENSFTSPLKTFRSGKFYILRVSIPTYLGKTNIKIYDEKENVLDLENITENDNVVSALEILGIKCSPRSFQIEIELKQLLKLQKNNIFEKCILGKPHLSNLEIKSEKIDNEIITENQSVDRDSNELKNENNDESIQESQEDTSEVITNLESDNVSDIDLEIDNDENYENYENYENDENTQNNILIEKEIDNNNELKEVDINLEEIESDEKNNESNLPIEVDIPLEKIVTDPISLRKRNEIYYELYRDALNKAKEAKDLALTRFLEAKEIKNKYMLNDIDSDLEDESIELLEE